VSVSFSLFPFFLSPSLLYIPAPSPPHPVVTRRLTPPLPPPPNPAAACSYSIKGPRRTRLRARRGRMPARARRHRARWTPPPTSSSSARTGGRGRHTGARACPSQPRARPRRSSHPKRHRAQAAPASSVPATARCSIKSAMLRPPRVDSSRYELPCHLRPLPQLSVRLLLTRSIVPLAARAAMAVPRTSAVSPLPGLLLKRESGPHGPAVTS